MAEDPVSIGAQLSSPGGASKRAASVSAARTYTSGRPPWFDVHGELKVQPYLHTAAGSL